jgi:hypothetical protein
VLASDIIHIVINLLKIITAINLVNGDVFLQTVSLKKVSNLNSKRLILLLRLIGAASCLVVRMINLTSS